jgi:hypothetical protein
LKNEEKCVICVEYNKKSKTNSANYDVKHSSLDSKKISKTRISKKNKAE